MAPAVKWAYMAGWKTTFGFAFLSYQSERYPSCY
jgi:hypothetical protein